MAGVDHSTRFDGLGPSTNIGTSIDSGSKRISPTRERIAKHEGKSVVARWECRRRLEEGACRDVATDVLHWVCDSINIDEC